MLQVQYRNAQDVGI